jgi:hypothetical protein
MTVRTLRGRKATFRGWLLCDGCGEPATPRESVLAVDYDAINDYEEVKARWKAQHEPDDQRYRVITAAQLMEYPHAVRWWWGHVRCVPFNRYYDIDAERMQTLDELMSWTLHLMGTKSAWFRHTNWEVTVRRLYALPNP